MRAGLGVGDLCCGCSLCWLLMIRALGRRHSSLGCLAEGPSTTGTAAAAPTPASWPVRRGARRGQHGGCAARAVDGERDGTGAAASVACLPRRAERETLGAGWLQLHGAFCGVV